MYWEGLRKISSSENERMRRDITRRVVWSGKSAGGQEGNRGHLSLLFLSLFPVLLCVGSSKLLQYFLNIIYTFKYPHPSWWHTSNHATFSFMLKTNHSSRLLHTLRTISDIFNWNPLPQTQKINYISEALHVSQRNPKIGTFTATLFYQGQTKLQECKAIHAAWCWDQGLVPVCFIYQHK